MKQSRKEFGVKTEMLETQLRDWGIDLEKFKAKTGIVKGEVKAQLESEVEMLQGELNEGWKKINALKKSGEAASEDLKKGVEGAYSKLEEAFKNAKSKFK